MCLNVWSWFLAVVQFGGALESLVGGGLEEKVDHEHVGHRIGRLWFISSPISCFLPVEM